MLMLLLCLHKIQFIKLYTTLQVNQGFRHKLFQHNMFPNLTMNAAKAVLEQPVLNTYRSNVPGQERQVSLEAMEKPGPDIRMSLLCQFIYLLRLLDRIEGISNERLEIERPESKGKTRAGVPIDRSDSRAATLANSV